MRRVELGDIMEERLRRNERWGSKEKWGRDSGRKFGEVEEMIGGGISKVRGIEGEEVGKVRKNVGRSEG